jgi:hypothetical protein
MCRSKSSSDASRPLAGPVWASESAETVSSSFRPPFHGDPMPLPPQTDRSQSAKSSGIIGGDSVLLEGEFLAGSARGPLDPYSTVAMPAIIAVG